MLKHHLNNMKAICIDSSNKPDRISEYEWIEEGMVYTITGVVEMGLQKGKLGITLAEVELTAASAPYEYYSLERFLIIPDESRIDFESKRKGTIFKKSKEKDIFAKDADLTNSI